MAYCIKVTAYLHTALAVKPLLSSHEVAQGYKDVKDLSATVKFKRLDADE